MKAREDEEAQQGNGHIIARDFDSMINTNLFITFAKYHNLSCWVVRSVAQKSCDPTQGECLDDERNVPLLLFFIILGRLLMRLLACRPIVFVTFNYMLALAAFMASCEWDVHSKLM